VSTSSLLAFCNKLDATLKSPKGSQIYRDLVANKRVHVFKFSSKAMAEQMKIELDNHPSFDGLTQKDRQVVNKLAKIMKDDLLSGLTKLAKSNPNSKLKTTTNTISFKFDVNTETNNVITLYSGKTVVLDAEDVFQKVKRFYRPALKKFFNGVQEHLKGTVKVNPESGRMVNRSLRTSSGKTKKGTRELFHAGHEKGAGIFESFMRDAFEGIASSTNLTSGATQKDLQQLGMTSLVTAVRNDKEDSHTIAIESAYLNTQGKSGGVDVASLRRQLQTQLKKAIDKLAVAEKLGSGLEHLQGSDSINTKKQKVLMGSVLNSFVENQKSKSLKVTVKNDLGLPNSKSGKKSTKKKAKVSKAATAIALGKGVKAGRVKRERKVTEGPASSPLRLITEFNRQLPSVVRKNMGSPALNNITGRFADSVRVENIIKTPKGFPSVGYTYQRDPYQVFEEGVGSPPWANGNRDPRDLIDKSVREIAATMALGRFYTRRI
jgi:hypothetical protein